MSGSKVEAFFREHKVGVFTCEQVAVITGLDKRSVRRACSLLLRKKRPIIREERRYHKPTLFYWRW